jgi:D-glutamate cyclase
MGTGLLLDEKISSLEAIVSQDVGESSQALIQHARGGLLGAARSIAKHPEPKVVLVTGAFMPWADPPAAETDGPVGTAELAVGLSRAGSSVRVVTDEPCARAVGVALGVAGSSDEIPLDVVPVSEGSQPAIDTLIARYRDEALVTHVIAVERLGPSPDGRVYDMSGRDLSPHTAALADLFSVPGWTRIGIGDRGNEVGMGLLPPALIADSIGLGAQIRCVVPCDHLIVSSTSNWGAQALLAAVAILREESTEKLLACFSPEHDSTILRETVMNGPAVDGVTQRQEASVDGLPAVDHARVVREILRVTRGR